jgi:DHH subfamily 1 protein
MAEDFKGGGHLNAAGGESYVSMRATLSMLEEAILNRKRYEKE